VPEELCSDPKRSASSVTHTHTHTASPRPTVTAATHAGGRRVGLCLAGPAPALHTASLWFTPTSRRSGCTAALPRPGPPRGASVFCALAAAWKPQRGGRGRDELTPPPARQAAQSLTGSRCRRGRADRKVRPSSAPCRASGRELRALGGSCTPEEHDLVASPLFLRSASRLSSSPRTAAGEIKVKTPSWLVRPPYAGDPSSRGPGAPRCSAQRQERRSRYCSSSLPPRALDRPSLLLFLLEQTPQLLLGKQRGPDHRLVLIRSWYFPEIAGPG
jgi:hypothetical protein